MACTEPKLEAELEGVHKMERQAVDSSSIASIGYSPGSETLEIEFKNQTIYEYYNVPQVIYDQLMEALSVGSYFSANIRNAFANSRV
jgi:KTSC domain